MSRRPPATQSSGVDLKKNTGATESTQTEGNFVQRHLEAIRGPSGIQRLIQSEPDRFVSLDEVLEGLCEAIGGSRREAAAFLLIRLESDPAFPGWRRMTFEKSQGVQYPEDAVWGRRLLEHVQTLGGPVRYPHSDFEINGYTYECLAASPPGSVYRFLVEGPTLGFAKAEIEGYLGGSAQPSPGDGGDAGPPEPPSSVHTTQGSRGNELSALIAKAFDELGSEAEPSAVLTLIAEWAERKPPVPPLNGTSKDGLHWGSLGNEQTISRKLLQNRIYKVRDKRLKKKGKGGSSGR